MKSKHMNLIKEIKITPHEAKELVHLGFILKLVSIGQSVDTYNVYVIKKN